MTIFNFISAEFNFLSITKYHGGMLGLLISYVIKSK